MINDLNIEKTTAVEAYQKNAELKEKVNARMLKDASKLNADNLQQKQMKIKTKQIIQKTTNNKN